MKHDTAQRLCALHRLTPAETAQAMDALLDRPIRWPFKRPAPISREAYDPSAPLSTALSAESRMRLYFALT